MADMPLDEGTIVESVLKRDRAIILTALSAVMIFAWVYTLAGAGMEMSTFEMTVMAGRLGEIVMPPAIWSPTHAGMVFVMWWVMLIAMMTPGATHTVLLYAGTNRQRRDPANAYGSAGLFLFGYLTIWALFSLSATALQWTLEQASLMSSAMSTANAKLAGGVFIAAGLYQFTGVKQACLKHCRHPLPIFTSHWRDGLTGAFRMGLAHGAFCLGSCWLLIALLFVGGIMNVIWITGLALYVMLEKVNRFGRTLSVMFGSALACWGIFVLVTALRP